MSNNLFSELTAEQLATLERIEKLNELDPEVTTKLARALDRLQQTQPYQQLIRRTPSEPTEPLPPLSEEEQAIRREFVEQEIDSLLAIVGQLNGAFEGNRLKAQPDRRFKEQLRSQFK